MEKPEDSNCINHCPQEAGNIPEFICVLDFEATCDNVTKYNHEIIEFPSVLLKFDGTNYVSVAEFQEFCKPLVKPVITKFCNELTGITQEQVDSGNNFVDTIINHEQWLNEKTEGNVLILTCGFWDLGIVLISECRKWHVTPSDLYLKVINIKNEFRDFYNKNGGGMAGMLRELNIPLEGKHHSGIADCRNIAKILQRMVADGYSVTEKSLTVIDKEKYRIQKTGRKKYKDEEVLIKARLYR